MELSVIYSKINSQPTITVFYLQVLMPFNEMQNTDGSIVSENNLSSGCNIWRKPARLQLRSCLYSLISMQQPMGICWKQGLYVNSVLKPESSPTYIDLSLYMFWITDSSDAYLIPLFLLKTQVFLFLPSLEHNIMSLCNLCDSFLRCILISEPRIRLIKSDGN